MSPSNDSYKIAKDRYKSICNRNALAKTSLKEDEFINWYGDDQKNRQCKYCLINESQIKDMINKGLIRTKRLSTRGRTMEVDRKNPKGKYEIDNLVMSCYWCNNAKTDEFTYEEFRDIACIMKYIWKNRINTVPDIVNIDENDRLFCEWNEPRGIVMVLPWGMWSLKKDEERNEYVQNIKNLISKIQNNEIVVNIVFRDSSTHAQKVKTTINDINNANSDKKSNLCYIGISQLSDIYLKSIMPMTLRKDPDQTVTNKAVKGVFSPSYYDDNECPDCKNCNRKYSYYEHVSALEIAEALNLQTRYISKNGAGYWYEGCDDIYIKDIQKEHLPIILDANNILHNGEIGFISQTVIDENCSNSNDKNEQEYILNLLKDNLGLQEICIVEIDKCETLSNHIRFLNPTKLLYKRGCKPTFHSTKIDFVAVDYDLDYLRIGNTIIGSKRQCEALKPLEPMCLYIEFETQFSLNKISWIY